MERQISLKLTELACIFQILYFKDYCLHSSHLQVFWLPQLALRYPMRLWVIATGDQYFLIRRAAKTSWLSSLIKFPRYHCFFYLPEWLLTATFSSVMSLSDSVGLMMQHCRVKSLSHLIKPMCKLSHSMNPLTCNLSERQTERLTRRHLQKISQLDDK